MSHLSSVHNATVTGRIADLGELHKESQSHYAKTFFRKGATTVAFLTSANCWTRYSITNVLPGLRRKRTGPLLSGPRSSFQMKRKCRISFGNWGPRVWRKREKPLNPRCLVQSLQSVCCILSRLKSTQVSTRRFLHHFMFPSTHKLEGDLVFLFQEDLAAQAQIYFPIARRIHEVSSNRRWEPPNTG